MLKLFYPTPKWDLRSLYLIAQDANGYCKDFEQSTCRCTIREHRPIPCRAYPAPRGAASATRRGNDQRIWLDFEKKIVKPEIDLLFQKQLFF